MFGQIPFLGPKEQILTLKHFSVFEGKLSSCKCFLMCNEKYKYKNYYILFKMQILTFEIL